MQSDVDVQGRVCVFGEVELCLAVVLEAMAIVARPTL